MSLQMTLSKRRNLRQLVKSYAQIHKTKASYKERTDSLQSLDHKVLASWLKDADNRNTNASTWHLMKEQESGSAHTGDNLAAWPTEAELPPWTAQLVPTCPPCCLHRQSRRAGADGTVSGEKFWAPPFHCNYLMWQSFAHSLLHSQGVRLIRINLFL